jgi:hypothetical protein
MLSGIRHELQLALRGLARRPGFNASSIATLALGIGASTAIFSVAYGISILRVHSVPSEIRPSTPVRIPLHLTTAGV